MALTLGQELRLAALRVKRGERPPESLRRMIAAAIARASDKSAGPAPAFEATLQRIWNGSRELDQAGSALGRSGWTIPPWATWDEVLSLASLQSRRSLDRAVLRAYTRRPRLLEDIHRDVLASPAASQWRPLYRQAAHLAAAGQSLVVVPSLLLVFEGVLVGMDESARLTTKPAAVIKPLAEAATGSPRAQWMSLLAFTEELFASRRPGRVDSSWLSRPLILHGRVAPRWGRIDSLRLFQAIGTACLLAQVRPTPGRKLRPHR